jgi:FtsZ-binding cell division protein ZapB
MSKSKNTDLEYKLGEAIKIVESLRREIEQLKWERGSKLVDLREENEQLRMQFDEFKELTTNLVNYTYADEERHYEEGESEEHIFHTIKSLDKLLNQ